MFRFRCIKLLIYFLFIPCYFSLPYLFNESLIFYFHVCFGVILCFVLQGCQFLFVGWFKVCLVWGLDLFFICLFIIGPHSVAQVYLEFTMCCRIIWTAAILLLWPLYSWIATIPSINQQHPMLYFNSSFDFLTMCTFFQVTRVRISK